LDTPFEQQTDAAISALRTENKRLKEQLASLGRLALRLNKENVQLRHNNRVVTRRNVALQRRCQNLEQNMSKTFNADKITAMGRRSTQGMAFGPATIKDALVLKMKCETSGCEYLRKKLPFYPCACTLQRHAEHIEFKSGILEEVFAIILQDIRYRK